MKKVAETKIDMKMVEQILRGSAQIDAWKEDIKESVAFLCGVIKKIFEERPNPKTLGFCTEEKDGFHWEVGVQSGGYSKELHAVYVTAYFGDIPYSLSNFSQTSLGVARVKVMWTALPLLFQIVREHIPELDEKLIPYIEAGKEQ